MAVLPLSQEPDWSTNPYVLTVTRVLILVGLSYTLRSLFQLLRWSFTESPVPAIDSFVGGTPGIDLEAGPSGDPFELDLDIDVHQAETSPIRPLQQAHVRRDHARRSYPPQSFRPSPHPLIANPGEARSDVLPHVARIDAISNETEVGQLPSM